MKLKVLEPLGSGDMYRGLLLPERRPVAITTLSNWCALSIAHLQSAAESIAQLAHPNLVELLGIHDALDEPCFVFEWIDGVDLSRLLPHAPVPLSVALYIARELLTALAHIHSQGVVHRRLSPPKVLISRTGDVKLAGAGVMLTRRSPLTTGDALRSALPYISPEQLRGHHPDHRSDMFVVGVLLYQLLIGRSPFGDTTNDALQALLQCAPRRPRSLAPELPKPLDNLLMRLLSPPSERYTSAEAVRAALSRTMTEPASGDAIIRFLHSALPITEARHSGWYAGPRMNRYQRQERLGHGGMGEVWKGTRSFGNGPPQTVAFKFIRDRLQRGVATIEQFEREARTAVTLRHPNIAGVYDFTEVDSQPCIVMEYVDGINLGQLARHGAIPAKLVRCLLHDVLSGLQYAHDRGILHRDLSLANIMIDRRGVAHLMDFGVAKNLHDSHSLGLLVGTAPFMAPEVLEAQQWSRASDIYSLGAVCYALLTGELPYGNGDRLDIMNEMRSRGLRPLPESVPADLRVFVMAALHPARERLTSDYSAAVDALEPTGSAERNLLSAAVARTVGKSDPRGIESQSTQSASKNDSNAHKSPPAPLQADSCRESVSASPARTVSRKRRLLASLAAVALLALGLVAGEYWRDKAEPTGLSERDAGVVNESVSEPPAPAPVPLRESEKRTEKPPAPLPEQARKRPTPPPRRSATRTPAVLPGVLVSP